MQQHGSSEAPGVSRPMVCVIAVCTFRRPLMLRRCLESIAAQDIPPGWDVSVLVIDNDPQGHPDASLEQWLQSCPLRVEPMHEPERGIPFARNLACRRSVELGADWLAFIDDDEEALPGWLLAYAAAMERFEAEVYTGPVRYEMPEHHAAYLANRGLQRCADGSRLPRAATSNVLMSTALLQPPWSMQFDTRMAFTGGSDSDFFTCCAFRGARIVCVSGALVSEPVMENRLTIRWRLSRQFRSSANRIYTRYKLQGVPSTVWHGAVEVVWRLVRGSLRLLTVPVFGLTRGRAGLMHAWYHCLRHFAKGFGTLSGLFGLQPRTYWKTDGY